MLTEVVRRDSRKADQYVSRNGHLWDATSVPFFLFAS